MVSKFLKFSLLFSVIGMEARSSQLAYQQPVQPVYSAQAGAVQQQNPQANLNNSQQNQYGAYNSNANTAGGMSKLDTGSDDVSNEQSDNIFLNLPETKAGLDISGTPIYIQSVGANLKETYLGNLSLNKALVVFFGDWCMFCEQFLKSFANYVEILRLSGVKVIFVHVPSNDKLKKLGVEKPTVDDFNAAENKISGFGIKLSNNDVKVVALAKKSTLSKLQMDGLPVVIGVKNGSEAFRCVGQSGVANLTKLSDQNVLKQLLSVWDKKTKKSKIEDTEKFEEDTSVSESIENTEIENNHKKKTSSKKMKKTNQKPSKKDLNQRYLNSEVDIEKARRATEFLNNITPQPKQPQKSKCFFS